MTFTAGPEDPAANVSSIISGTSTVSGFDDDVAFDEAACQCQARTTTQNAHQELLDVLGARRGCL